MKLYIFLTFISDLPNGDDIYPTAFFSVGIFHNFPSQYVGCTVFIVHIISALWLFTTHFLHLKSAHCFSTS